MPEYLTARGVGFRAKDEKNRGRTVYALDECPFDPGHKDGDACIMQADDGELSAKCFHNGCQGRGWQQFKEKIGRPDRDHYDPALPESPKVTWTGGEHTAGESPGRGATAGESESDFPPFSPAWPEPMSREAFHGITGDFVRAVEPASEADPVARLVSFLLGVGNLVGRTLYALVEGDRHYLNEYGVLIGRSAKGRKGTSMGRVKQVLSRAEEHWSESRIVSGLSSGEGVIWNVRDPIEKQEKVSGGKGETPRYETVVADPGEEDKRLFVVEPEFANVLKQTERQGNTLSAVLRQGWDVGNLRSLVKNSPTKATGAHLSIIGHITDEELRRYPSATESANGFGNRFMWFLVKRSKLLPDGGTPDQREIAAVESALAEVLRWVRDRLAKGAEQITRDAAAAELWRTLYPELSRDRHGLAGSLTGRAEAHVLRLSLTYAVLDRSEFVEVEHLMAALAVWDYAEQSVVCTFGDSTGNPMADDILAVLRKAPAGLTRTEIRDFVGKNAPAERIGQALGVLLTHGLAHTEKRETAGRPSEVWLATARKRGAAGA